MAAFQAYAGAYGHAGQLYDWKCYATARVYEVRQGEHAPLPQAPQGRVWVSAAADGRGGPPVACLLDGTATEFSHILLQIRPRQLPLPALASA